MDQDKKLLEQCIQGRPEAWRAFIKKYSPLVYYITRKVLISKCPETRPEELGDLHNDIFLSLMENNSRKLRQYEGKNGCSVSTWVRVIAARTTIDYLKKKREGLSLSDEEAEREAEKKSAPGADPLEALEAAEKQRLVAELIEELPTRDQLFLRLFYYDEVSLPEIAKMLNSSPNALYSRGNYLREKLKEQLQKKISKKAGGPSSI